MHLMNEVEFVRMFTNSNMCNKGHLLSLCAGWALRYLTALSLPYLGLSLPPRHFQRVVQFQLGLKTCLIVRCPKCCLHMMDPYDDHAVTYKHGPLTIHRHDHMPYVQNIITNEVSLKSRLKKTDLIANRIILPLYYHFTLVHTFSEHFLNLPSN
jgi:hypothetical protein